jgi:hypothetical protein
VTGNEIEKQHKSFQLFSTKNVFSSSRLSKLKTQKLPTPFSLSFFCLQFLAKRRIRVFFSLSLRLSRSLFLSMKIRVKKSRKNIKNIKILKTH